MRFRFLFLIVLTTVTFNACEEVDPAEDALLLHLPLKEGNWWMYDVVESTYSVGQESSITYQLMDSVRFVEEDNFSNRTYYIGRFVYDEVIERWLLLETFTVNKVWKQVLFNRGNIPTIDLVYPPFEGKSWDANVYNTLDEDIYVMKDVDKSFTTLSGRDFTNTVTVIQEDNEDLIVNHVKEYQVFSEAIGMVEYRSFSFFFCQQPACLGQQEIEFGSDRTWTLTDHNVN